MKVEGKVSRNSYNDLIELYEHLPIKLKRDKNKSENVYFILNSNKRGGFQTKEQLLQDLKEQNDRMHLSKLMTLIAIKIEEKYNSMSKAYLYFDQNGNKLIDKAEFARGVEGLRVKLPVREVE